MEFGDRVRALMKKEGMSQNQLAQKTGEHATAISSYLSGGRKPKVEFIMNLIQVFPKADLNWLFRGESNAQNVANDEEAQYNIPETPEVLIANIEESARKLKALLSQK